MKNTFFQFACSLILLCVLCWSCQTPDLPVPIKPLPVLGTADSACIPAKPKWFDLEPISTTGNGQNADYAYDLVTAPHPFQLNECLCAVKRYEFAFDSLPTADKITVTDEFGNPVPFTIHLDPATGRKVITVSASEFDDGYTKVYIEIDETPIPEIQQAGGLCIVDNLGGFNGSGDTTTVHFDPAIVTASPPNSPPVQLIIIPNSMTSSYPHSIPY